jgi:hypothetical protein
MPRAAEACSYNVYAVRSTKGRQQHLRYPFPQQQICCLTEHHSVTTSRDSKQAQQKMVAEDTLKHNAANTILTAPHVLLYRLHIQDSHHDAVHVPSDPPIAGMLANMRHVYSLLHSTIRHVLCSTQQLGGELTKLE